MIPRSLFWLSLAYSVLFLGLASKAAAQRHEAVWYFGRGAGIDFNRGYPVALTDGRVSTREATAAVCDSAGQLLLYTDGSTVWNRHHRPVSGSGALGGDWSSSQGALWIPRPEAPGQYYLWTTDSVGLGARLRYSLLDTYAAQGEGAVLAQPMALLDSATEKLAGWIAADGSHAWVLGQSINSTELWAWRIDAQGVSAPVRSVASVGCYNSPVFGPGGNAWLQVSPRGNLLASALVAPLTEPTPGVELMHFDTLTGQVAPYGFLPLATEPYGLCFAPEGQFLYVTQNNSLWQFDLQAGSLDQIRSSGREVGRADRYLQSVQRALDGTLYVAHRQRQQLSQVLRPDVAGPGCGFVANSFGLKTGECFDGLPNIPVRSGQSSWGFRYQGFCANTQIAFAAHDSLAEAWLWHFGDPASGPLDTSRLAKPEHRYSAPGLYWVHVQSFAHGRLRASYRQSVRVYAPPTLAAIANQELCEGAAVWVPRPELPSPGGFVWFDGSEADSVRISQPGAYSYRYTQPDACTLAGQWQVTRKTPPQFSIAAQSLCWGASIELRGDTVANEWLWNDGYTQRMRPATESGLYALMATNICGSTRAEATIEVRYCQQVKIPNVVRRSDPQGFRIEGWEGARWQLHVWDRWGSLRFHSTDYRNQWPSFDLSEGVYYYLLQNQSTGQLHKGFFHVL